MRPSSFVISALAILSIATSAKAQNRQFFGGGVGLFNPIVDVVSTGTRTVVSPTVSADRKYVTISGQFQNSQLLSIQNFPFFQINNGAGGGVVGGGVQLPSAGGVNGGSQANAPSGAAMEAGGPVQIQRGGGGRVLSQVGMTRIASN